MPNAFPIFLNLDGAPVLIVGLGRVGRRRAALLLDAGAHVLAVDPDEAITPPSGVELRREVYNSAHLEGRRLVLAAAPAEVNQAVAADCRTRGVWVNNASDPAGSDFLLPATRRDGPITLALATGGSPALARTLCDHAAATLPPQAAALAALLNTLRPELLQRVSDPIARARLLRDWSDREWLTHLQTHGPEATEAALRRRMP